MMRSFSHSDHHIVMIHVSTISILLRHFFSISFFFMKSYTAAFVKAISEFLLTSALFMFSFQFFHGMAHLHSEYAII